MKRQWNHHRERQEAQNKLHSSLRGSELSYLSLDMSMKRTWDVQLLLQRRISNPRPGKHLSRETLWLKTKKGKKKTLGLILHRHETSWVLLQNFLPSCLSSSWQDSSHWPSFTTLRAVVGKTSQETKFDWIVIIILQEEMRRRTRGVKSLVSFLVLVLWCQEWHSLEEVPTEEETVLIESKALRQKEINQ